MVKSSLRRPGKRQQIKDEIRRWIAEENMQAGEQILGQNALAERFDTTVVTIHKALTELAKEDVLYRQTGRGTFVGKSPERTKAKQLCVVLPGENLDKPEINPLYWPYVQHLYRAFMEGLPENWSFTTRAVDPQMPAKKAAAAFSGIDVVFFHHNQEPRELIKHLIAKGTAPVVCFGAPRSGVECLTVDHNATEGARRATSYLIKLGHERIAFIGSSEYWGDLHFAGYHRALKEHNLTLDPKITMRIGESQQEGARAAQCVMDSGQPFDAIYVDADMRALGAVDCLRHNGVNVPNDVSVMGYEGLDHATRQPPYLTTVQIPFEKMIAAALDIVQKNPGKPTPVKHLDFVGEILENQTCARRRR